MRDARLLHLLIAALICAMAGCAPRGAPAPLVIGNASGSDGAPGNTPPSGAVVVQPGDTLSAIARYHNTALQALVEANGLQDPNRIRAGQVLRLPAQTGGAAPASVAVTARPPAPPPLSSQVQSARLPAPAPPPAPARMAEAPARTPVAKQDKPPAPVAPPPVMAADNEAEDGGEDQTGLLEENAKTEDAPPPPPEEPARGNPAPEKKLAAALPPPAPAPAPAPIPALPPPPAKAPPAPSSQESVRFLWPATGPILSDFGSKPNGLHNDGINIAMPPNGPVYAAGDGEVIYAGDGLRGYGNLLLLRHAGGWVTAYAHNAKLLVGRGDKVKRGQAIARAGRSGGVSQDQLHFEIRQGAKAVNPKPLLVEG